MTNEELARSCKALRVLCEELVSSKEEALAFLVEMGMVTSAGELTGAYRTEQESPHLANKQLRHP